MDPLFRGVLFRRRLPLKRGPYSTPKDILSEGTLRRLALEPLLELVTLVESLNGGLDR